MWAAARADRNGAQAIALYDPVGDRHRWVTVTRGCVNGTTVEWVAHGDGVAIGVSASRHPVCAEQDGVLVLDLVRGVAFRLLRPLGHDPADESPWRPVEAQSTGIVLRTAGASIPIGFDALVARAAERAMRPAWSEGD